MKKINNEKKDYNYIINNLLNNYMNCCYEFLEITKTDTIYTLRENFLYKIFEAYQEKIGICDYHNAYFEYDKTISNYEFMEYNDYKCEQKALETDIRCLLNSYLAILLSKSKNKDYNEIIEGLISIWKYQHSFFIREDNGKIDYNPYFPLRFPRNNEDTKMNKPERISKEEYLNILKRINDYSTNDGFNNFTSTLSVIINLEKKFMDNNQVIKFYKKQMLPIGRIVEENQQKRRLVYMNKNMPHN